MEGMASTDSYIRPSSRSMLTACILVYNQVKGIEVQIMFAGEDGGRDHERGKHEL